MSELSPKELDKLLQDGSEQYNFDYNPEAWKQMENLLDKDRRRRLIWWWFWGAGLVLLAGGIGFWWTWNPESTIRQTTVPALEQPVVQNHPIDSLTKTHPETISPSPNSAEIKINKTEINKIQNPETKQTQPAATEIPVRKKKKKTNPITPVLKAQQQVMVQHEALEKHRPDTSAHSEATPPALAQSPMIQNNAPEKASEINTVLPLLPLLPFAALEMESNDLPALRLPGFGAAEDPRSRIQEVPKDKTFILGLTTNAETASAGFDRFSKPNNLGIGGYMEFRYAEKYSVSLGAQYIRIKYEAGAGKYLPGSDFWIRGIEPESTSATCKILEIPLLLGYYPKGYAKSGFYAKAGLSSYLMLKEYYHYHYAVYDTDLLTGWGEKNNYRHWFGIGLVSVGYNQVLGRKTSIQIAPYLQIPLARVGHGEIKLWSAGLSLTGNFQVN